jgi:hypothetical protein
MKRIYGESGQYSIAEENELFGIVDNSGHLLLPLEYDRITVAYGIKDGFGFILCKNGKFGYVEFGGREHLNEYEDRVVPDDPNGCALAFLPCIYDWIEAKRNGLAMYSEREKEIKDLWYDYKSRTLYRKVRYQDNLGDFDVLIDFSRGPCIPEIKKAGADEWVRFPKESDIDILGLVHTDLCGVTFALCSEWITETEEKIRELPTENPSFFEVEEYEEIADEYLEYSFLLLYKNGWIATHAKRTLAELYAEIPSITKKHTLHESETSRNDKSSYRLRCEYKKRREIWD